MRSFILGFHVASFSQLARPLEDARWDYGYDVVRLQNEAKWPRLWYHDEDEEGVHLVFWTPLWWKKAKYTWQFLRWSGAYSPEFWPEGL